MADGVWLTYGAACDVFVCARVVREGLEHGEAEVRADSLRLLLAVLDQVRPTLAVLPCRAVRNLPPVSYRRHRH